MEQTMLQQLEKDITELKNNSQQRQDKHAKPFNCRREGYIEGIEKSLEIIRGSIEKEQTQRRDDFLRGVEYGKHEQIKKEGYAGILPNGNIVDRREYPDAFPMQENSLLGIPKPKSL